LLYTRGGESVRLVRERLPLHGIRLVTFGPGAAQTVYAFEDEGNCLYQQAAIEQALDRRGFHIDESVGERRKSDAPWSGPERRRR
jgi:hypothetical protein